LKSEWEFVFHTRGFRFEREHKFKALPSIPIKLGERDPENIEPFVRIVPGEDDVPPGVEQTGKVYVLLPGSRVDTRDFALHVARLVADRITFDQGDFRIQYGLLSCKRIAETAEEEAEFGDKLWSTEVHLEEVIPASTFDSTTLVKTPQNPRHVALISQFNDATRDERPISQFLGFLKILESVFHAESKKVSLREALTQDSNFRKLFEHVVKGGNIEEAVSKLVAVRHKCAHLKLQTGFGYVPIDPAVETEVKPLISLVATLAHFAITGWAANTDA
jgi:hypothetical protein